MGNFWSLCTESLFIKFYFCGRYINADVDDKKVERDMYAAIRVLMIIMGMKIEKTILKIYKSYFSLTSEQKYRYAPMKLVG